MDYLGLIVFGTVLLVCNTVPVTGQCSSTTLELSATTSQKTIASPNYPNLYSADSLCAWKLSAPSSDYRIMLEVTDSVLEDPYSGDCAYDYVAVRDGATSSSDILVQWCGTEYSPYITSSGADLYIEFVSDSATQRTGFSITYQSFAVGSCPLNWYGNDSYCYRMRTDVANWNDAQTQCMNDASNLLTLRNDEESEYLQSTFSGPWSYTWMGLERYASNSVTEFKWIDRSAYNYQNWTAGHPEEWAGDEKCAVFDLSDGSWLVQSCYNEFAFICKKTIGGTTQRYLPGGQPLEDESTGSFSLWGIIILCALGVLVIIGIQAAVRWKISQRNQTAPMDEDEETGGSSTARHKTSSRATNGSTQGSRDSPRKLGWENNSHSGHNRDRGGNLPPLLKELDRGGKAKRKKKKRLPPVRRISSKRSTSGNQRVIEPNPPGAVPMDAPPGTIAEDSYVTHSSPHQKRTTKLSSLAGVERSQSFDM